MRYTEYHAGKAVIKDKNKLSEAMEKLARYEENYEGGTFYPGDDEKSYSSYGIFVNAWMPLPELYKTTKELRND